MNETLKALALMVLGTTLAATTFAANDTSVPSLAATTLAANDASVPSLNDSSRVHDIEEVVVVALPKEPYRLRQQPLSSTAFAEADLSRLSARSLKDVALYVPSLAMPDYGSRLTSSLYMRGVGSRINSPGVGIYLDGIPLVCKSAFNFHSYELSRIDVLRGPQGTLYGQNTEGGLVRLHTISPSNYQGTNLHLGLSSHFGRLAELAHYGKLSDHAAYSLAGFYTGTNGFLHNQTTGERADQADEAGARVRLNWKPSQPWTVALLADYQYTRQRGFAYGLLDQETGAVSDPSSNYQGRYRRNMVNTGLTVDYKTSALEFNSTTSWQFLSDDMFMDQDYLPQDYMHLTQSQLQNAVTQEFTLGSRQSKQWNWTSGVFASHQWLRTVAPVFFGSALTTPIASAIQTSMYNAMVSAMAQRFLATGMTEAAATAAAQRTIEAAGGVSMDVAMDVPGTFHTPNSNLGLFHESSLRLSERLTATLGLRYDLSHTQLRYDTRATMAMTANVMGTSATYTLLSALDHDASKTFHQLLPKLGLTYALGTEGSNVYALVSKGYRSGGYNIQMFSDILQTELTNHRSQAMRGDYTVEHTQENYDNVRRTISYDPETSWNYELGTHLNLFGGSMHLDLSAFCISIRGQQLSVMAEGYGFGRMMVNAGRSRSLGMELAMRGSAMAGRLTWSLGYSLTHATFRQYTDTIVSQGQSTAVSYRGNHVPYVPSHMLSATADRHFFFSGHLLEQLTFGLNLSAQGRTYWDEANTLSQPFYAVLGAHATAQIGKATIKIWGKNLTDTRYNTFAISSSATGEKKTFAQRAWPVTFGADLQVRF